eukprot:TRINITY_DN16532_c0_g1_i1.p1 TRINITY_DN16532_c0_g1~~TRINITY_DN16532_c0_g1_i1.p1  ORF type:complete len:213 (+),score=72.02 TRINITY_DN16532_c0_g1_i1:55-693(+)
MRNATVVRAKVAVVGDAAVGKSFLVRMWATGTAARKYSLTAGAELTVKELRAASGEDDGWDYCVEMHVFDVGGDDMYASLREQYLDGAAHVLVCYDSSDRRSFATVRRWCEWYQKQRGSAAGVLVALKGDLAAEVPHEHGEGLARRQGLRFFACSALRAEGVEQLWQHVADTAADRYRATLRRTRVSAQVAVKALSHTCAHLENDTVDLDAI